MSKSLKRVEAALSAAGVAHELKGLTASTRTAAEAAAAVGCEVDQIAKSILFKGETGGHVVLFVTAGGRQVDPERASALAGERLGKADADLIRAETGFVIGGVSPVGHLKPVRAFFDRHLLSFPLVWAAAGTPNHVFSIAPDALLTLSGATLADFSG